MDGTSNIGEFQPISLANCSYKIISQVLDNQLKLVVGDMVGHSQAAFIKGKFILDSVPVVEETIAHQRVTRNKGILIKVDFGNDFDTFGRVNLLRASMQEGMVIDFSIESENVSNHHGRRC